MKIQEIMQQEKYSNRRKADRSRRNGDAQCQLNRFRQKTEKKFYSADNDKIQNGIDNQLAHICMKMVPADGQQQEMLNGNEDVGPSEKYDASADGAQQNAGSYKHFVYFGIFLI